MLGDGCCGICWDVWGDVVWFVFYVGVLCIGMGIGGVFGVMCWW